MTAEQIREQISAIQKEIDKSLFENDEAAEVLYKRRKSLEFKLYKLECGEK